jgi:hypothetical protein
LMTNVDTAITDIMAYATDTTGFGIKFRLIHCVFILITR